MFTTILMFSFLFPFFAFRVLTRPDASSRRCAVLLVCAECPFDLRTADNFGPSNGLDNSESYRLGPICFNKDGSGDILYTSKVHSILKLSPFFHPQTGLL